MSPHALVLPPTLIRPFGGRHLGRRWTGFLLVALSPLTLAGAAAQASPQRSGALPALRTAAASVNLVAGPEAQLAGTVKDPAGYLVPHARLTLTPIPSPTAASLNVISVQADDAGAFRFPLLRPGPYLLDVVAAGFAPLHQDLLVADPQPGHAQHLDLTLQLSPIETRVDVSPDAAGTDSSPERNGSAIILRGADLAVLADDPATMRKQLEAIAGPSPDGVKFYIDGFDATRLPPKSDIREIRVNSNLYSAQYDTAGQGRVEVFTRIGSGALHGSLRLSGQTSRFNAQDPFAAQPPYASTQYNGFLNGPLGRHLAANLSFSRFAHDDSAIVDATGLDPSLNPLPIVQALPNSRIQTLFAPRLDVQPFHGTSTSLRYVFSSDTQAIAGVGGLSLASQASRLQNANQILQLLATHSFGLRTVNETRLQYTRTRNNRIAAATTPSLAVQGAFFGGGAIAGSERDNQDTYEIQNYFSHVFRQSFLRAGGRFRVLRDANVSTANFNGLYTFDSLAAFQATLRGQAQGLSPIQIRAAGGGPSLFSLTTGTPAAIVSRTDGALYAEDEWKFTPRFTASLGLRVESQSVIADHFDAAPRASLTYGHGKPGSIAAFTLRAGGGLFYQRFSTLGQLRAARQNGTRERQYQLRDPDLYPDLPSPASLGTVLPSSIYYMAPDLRAPYSLYTGAGIDHALGRSGTISLNYSMTHLVHAFQTRNVNAPLPGTYDLRLPGTGIRPIPTRGDMYEYGSEGISQQHALRLSSTFRKGPLSLSAYYSYTHTNADTNGGFPSNSYDQHADYGRADNDLRHQFYLYLNTALPFHFQSSTNLLAHSGAPFNIVLGQDWNGDTQYNDRPTFATDLTRPSVVATPWGAFDTAPIPGQRTIPINFGPGPGVLQLDQRLARTIAFAPKPRNTRGASVGRSVPSPTPRRYSLELSVYAENLLNRVNRAPPNGTLNSPLFGRSTSALGPRSIDFGLNLSF